MAKAKRKTKTFGEGIVADLKGLSRLLKSGKPVRCTTVTLKRRPKRSKPVKVKPVEAKLPATAWAFMDKDGEVYSIYPPCVKRNTFEPYNKEHLIRVLITIAPSRAKARKK